MVKGLLSCLNWKTLLYGLVCLLFPIVSLLVYIGVVLPLMLGLLVLFKNIFGFSGFLLFLFVLLVPFPLFCFSALKFAPYAMNMEDKLIDRMFGTFSEKMDEKWAKFVLCWLLTEQQPSDNELDAIEREFGDDYVRDLNRTLNEGDLKRATALIGKLDKKKKETVVEGLFKLTVADKVIGDREWEYLLQVMALIDLDTVTEELYKGKYAPYRAVFHNPFAKPDTTEIVNAESADGVVPSKEHGGEIIEGQPEGEQLKLGKR